MDRTLADALLARLHEYGFGLRIEIPMEQLEPGELAPATLVHRDDEQQVLLSYSREMTASVAGKISPQQQVGPLFIIGPRVTERSAEIMRNRGIHYLDGSGNAHISFGDVLLDVRGRKALAFESLPHISHRGGTNLMSPKRAQVIFAVLSWERLLQEPVRSLAQASQVSLGQAQKTLDLLIHLDFIDQSRRMASDRRERLLEQWVQAYPTGLGSRQLSLSMVGDVSLPIESDSPLIISGESAVGTTLRPETLTLYSSEAPADLIRARRWRREEAHPNIFLKERFWEDPDAPDRIITTIAPPLLVYADLLASRDSRQIEIAQQFRKHHDQLRAG